MIRKELEALTFDTPGQAAVEAPLTEMDLLNQVFTTSSSGGDAAVADDIRRISSQNYSSDILSDVFKRAADGGAASDQVSAASTQETRQQA